MYFFYVDESGSRDPSHGTVARPKDGVQLADLLAYNVYRAFRDEDPHYPYFRAVLPKIYRRRETGTLAGLKVWPETSQLVDLLGPDAGRNLRRESEVGLG